MSPSGHSGLSTELPPLRLGQERAGFRSPRWQRCPWPTGLRGRRHRPVPSARRWTYSTGVSLAVSLDPPSSTASIVARPPVVTRSLSWPRERRRPSASMTRWALCSTSSWVAASRCSCSSLAIPTHPGLMDARGRSTRWATSRRRDDCGGPSQRTRPSWTGTVQAWATDMTRKPDRLVSFRERHPLNNFWLDRPRFVSARWSPEEVHQRDGQDFGGSPSMPSRALPRLLSRVALVLLSEPSWPRRSRVRARARRPRRLMPLRRSGDRHA